MDQAHVVPVVHEWCFEPPIHDHVSVFSGLEDLALLDHARLFLGWVQLIVDYTRWVDVLHLGVNSDQIVLACGLGSLGDFGAPTVLLVVFFFCSELLAPFEVLVC